MGTSRIDAIGVMEMMRERGQRARATRRCRVAMNNKKGPAARLRQAKNTEKFVMCGSCVAGTEAKVVRIASRFDGATSDKRRLFATVRIHPRM